MSLRKIDLTFSFIMNVEPVSPNEIQLIQLKKQLNMDTFSRFERCIDVLRWLAWLI